MSSRVQAQTHARDDIWTLKRKNVRVAVASTLELNVISLWRDKFILFEAMSCFDDMSAYQYLFTLSLNLSHYQAPAQDVMSPTFPQR